MLWRCWLGARRELRDIRPERALLHNPKVPDSSLSACVLKVVRTAQYPSIPAVLRVNNNRRSQKVRWGNGPQAWKMPQNILTKNCAKFIYFFLPRTLFGRLTTAIQGPGVPPPQQEECPLPRQIPGYASVYTQRSLGAVWKPACSLLVIRVHDSCRKLNHVRAGCLATVA